MAKIMLVEDDPILGKGLMLHLQMAGHTVVWAKTLTEARTSEIKQPLDIVLLDANLPDGSGFEYCRELKTSGSRMPVLMLTARTDEDSVVKGFDSGANDYVRKPFSNRELLARIQSHLKETAVQDERLRHGPILVLLNQRKVLIDGEDMDFNRREFDIFSLLVKTPGAVLTREQLLNAINGADDILDRTIDSHFSHIRAKLKKKGVQSVAIRSVYGVGYTLEFS